MGKEKGREVDDGLTASLSFSASKRNLG